MAKWIWKRGENLANTWMCFVKDFACEEAPDTAIVKIAADTKYWLSINGKTALLEGGMKRGLTPASTYYDVLDIAGSIKKGFNTKSCGDSKQCFSLSSIRHWNRKIGIYQFLYCFLGEGCGGNRSLVSKERFPPQTFALSHSFPLVWKTM